MRIRNSTGRFDPDFLPGSVVIVPYGAAHHHHGIRSSPRGYFSRGGFYKISSGTNGQQGSLADKAQVLQAACFQDYLKMNGPHSLLYDLDLVIHIF